MTPGAPPSPGSTGTAGRGTGEGPTPAVPVTCTAARHGDANAYNLGCRCPDARADATRRRTLHQLRVAAGEQLRVDATGTRRRIRALIANGWPRERIATELDISKTALDYYSRRPRVLARTAAKVTALYQRFADIPGPSDSARAQARARGWLPPIWWDDDTIDDPTHNPVARCLHDDPDPVVIRRLSAGEPTDATPAELHAATRHLEAVGLSPVEIQRRLQPDVTRLLPCLGVAWTSKVSAQCRRLTNSANGYCNLHQDQAGVAS